MVKDQLYVIIISIGFDARRMTTQCLTTLLLSTNSTLLLLLIILSHPIQINGDGHTQRNETGDEDTHVNASTVSTKMSPENLDC